jgi:lysophospholipase L1-like esterase
MKTSLRIRLGLLLALAAVLAGCEGPCSKIESVSGPSLAANGVDLTTYVAVGTSLSAGYESGGIVDRHQIHSFPSLFARQIGKTVELAGGNGSFTQPTVNADGIPALLEVKSFRPTVINNTGRTQGLPTNSTQATAYHNMGVPGAILLDLVDTTHYHATVAPVFRNAGGQLMFTIIQRNRGTILSQALSKAPTIMSLEYGANEVLGPTTAGVAPSNLTAIGYRQLMTGALNAIHATLPNTKVAVFNVPDVTSAPFFTTFPAFTANDTSGAPMPLIGVNGPLAQGDFVLLTAGSLLAAGTGFPVHGVNYVNPAAPGAGAPLPESVILRSTEVAAAQAEIAGMNAVVDSVSLRPFVAKVDIHDFLQGIAANGYPFGGTVYTSAFVTGGLFSLDGVHPNDFGYALMANQLIGAVNSKFGSAIPLVNPADYASPTSSAAKPSDYSRYPAAVEGLDVTFEQLFPFRAKR